MTENVINFSKVKDERRLLWACNCGCTSHHAFADGAIQCASCDTVGVGYEGNWRERMPETPADAEPLNGDNFKAVFDLEGPEGFMRRHSKDPDVAFVAIAYADGSASTLNVSAYDTKERQDWFKRMLKRVATSLNPTRSGAVL